MKLVFKKYIYISYPTKTKRKHCLSCLFEPSSGQGISWQARPERDEGCEAPPQPRQQDAQSSGQSRFNTRAGVSVIKISFVH